MKIVEKEPTPLNIPVPVAPASAPAPVKVPDKCSVTSYKDGALSVTLRIEPDIAKRLRGRAGNMDLAKYLYDNVLYRSIIGHVY